MRLIPFLLSFSRGTFLFAVVAGLVSGLSNTGLLVLMNRSLHSPRAARGGLVLVFIALCVVVPLTRIVSELLLLHIGQARIYDLRMRMCRRILSVPLRDLERIGSARLNSVLTGDILNIANAVALVPVLFINIAITAGCMVYLGFLSWKVLLGVLLLIVLGVVGYQLPVARAAAYFRQSIQVRDRLYAGFRALIEGSKELKLHRRRREIFIDQSLDVSAMDQRRLLVQAQTIYTLASSWGQMLVFVIIGLVIFVVPQYFPGLASSETLTGFAFALLFLMTPLQVAMNVLPGLGQADAALQRVEEMGLTLRRQPSEDLAAPAAEGAAWQSLELAAVSHVYQRPGEERDFVLGPLDLRLGPGELVFLAGGNGSGKTTLAKLLVGLYPPQGGQILFNGEPVADHNREAYRQHFAVVFSDFYLFERLLGLEDHQVDERALHYLHELQIAHKVKVEGGRFSTTDLSQGQRKRLALLTAYLEDRPIYVFDEWAADQDPYFKDVFYLHLLPDLKRRGKTVLVITHDDRYYHLAERLLKLEGGQLHAAPPPAPAVGPAVGPVAAPPGTPLPPRPEVAAS